MPHGAAPGCSPGVLDTEGSIPSSGTRKEVIAIEAPTCAQDLIFKLPANRIGEICFYDERPDTPVFCQRDATHVLDGDPYCWDHAQKVASRVWGWMR